MFSSLIIAMVVAGTVRDPAGRPISGASVSIANIKTTESATDGTFTLDVPAGTYTLTTASNPRAIRLLTAPKKRRNSCILTGATVEF